MKLYTVICHLMYPAKSLAMYPFWGFFRLLKVGTKVQQCTQIGDLTDDKCALYREAVPWRPARSGTIWQTLVRFLEHGRLCWYALFFKIFSSDRRFLAISFKHSPLPHVLEPSKGTLRKDCLLRFVFHFDIRTVFLNVA